MPTPFEYKIYLDDYLAMSFYKQDAYYSYYKKLVDHYGNDRIKTNIPLNNRHNTGS